MEASNITRPAYLYFLEYLHFTTFGKGSHSDIEKGKVLYQEAASFNNRNTNHM